MDIRDLSMFDRALTWLTELREYSKPGGRASSCPTLARMVYRKAGALKDALDRLRCALDKAGPPPVLSPRQPLVLRQGDPVIQAIARLLRHHGVPEVELLDLHKELCGTYGQARVNDAVLELTWTDRETRWVKLRPETLRALRPFIGPAPDDPEMEKWWTGQGKEVPPFRSFETDRAKREAEARKPRFAQEEAKPEEKSQKRTRKKKTA